MEAVCDAEVEKMWEKRVHQWKIEKAARQKLLQEVLELRRQQIEQKCIGLLVLLLVLISIATLTEAF